MFTKTPSRTEVPGLTRGLASRLAARPVHAYAVNPRGTDSRPPPASAPPDLLRTMITFTVLCLAYVLSQFFRSFLAIVAPNLIAELGLGPAELGALSGIWFGAFAVAQFPIGWGLDTFGARRTIAGAMLCAIV